MIGGCVTIKKITVALLSFVLLFVASYFAYIFSNLPKEPPKSALLESRIVTPSFADPDYAVSLKQEKLQELNSLFNQPFYFIGEGKQCTAFVSRDGKYVIKFLLQKPLAVKKRVLGLPDHFPFNLFKTYKVKMKADRKKSLQAAFMLSYREIPEQTGTFFVHLNSTNERFIRPLILDQKGSVVSIDVNKTQFIVQKRAQHIKPVIMDLMWDGKFEEAKGRIDQLLDLLYECAQKQVVDDDSGLVRNNNIGFVDSRAIYIDTGKLRKVNAPLARSDFVKDLKRLQPFYRWLQTYYPNLALHYEAQQRKKIGEFENSR